MNALQLLRELTFLRVLQDKGMHTQIVSKCTYDSPAWSGTTSENQQKIL